MKERLQQVIEANVALQKRARELNVRAGEEVFPIMPQSEWKQWLTEGLKGARRISEVQDFDTLLLPALEQEVIDMILQENPDEITVMNILFPIAYRNGYAPQIKLEGEMVKGNRWMELPDAGIKLPGGRDVEAKVIIESGYYGSSYADTSIPALKEKVRNHFNQKVWENWEKPEITIPDLSIETATIPEIKTREYGKCVVTEVPLVAYGTVIAYQYWSNDPITWKYEWHRERNQAEKKREKAIKALAQYQSDERKKRELEAITVPDPSQEDAVIPEIVEIEGGYGFIQADTSYWDGTKFSVQWSEDSDYAERKKAEAMAKLEEIKDKEIEKRQLAEAKAEAETVKDQVRQAYNHSDQDKLDSSLRDKLYKFYYDYIPSELEEIRQWTTEAQNACAEAEKGLVEVERKRSERREKGIEIPDNLIRAYNGDEDKAFAFMQKVAKLRTSDLDEHIVCSCGRDRVRYHLTEVSGDDDFFLGADPNDVKHYVGDVHYYGENHGIPLIEVVQEPEFPTCDGDAHFEDLGKKHFRCPNGHTTRVTKSEWKAYQAGEAITVECSICNASGIVQKAVKNEQKATKKEENGSGLSLAEQLASAWN